MSKKDLKKACVMVHVPEGDGRYKKMLLTLDELSELMPCWCTPVEDPIPEPKAEEAPKKASKKKKKKE